MTGFEVILGTANIKGWLPMRQRLVRADLKTMYATGLQIMANQEFWLPRYRRPLRRLNAGLLSLGFAHLTPFRRSAVLSWSTGRFITIREEVLLLHKALPGVSDQRQIVAAWLKDRPSGIEFVAISTHPLPAPWKSTARQAMWNTGRTNLLHFVTAQVAAGYPVFIGCDANDYGAVFGTDVTVGGVKYPIRYVDHKIDHLVFIDAHGYRWEIDRETKRVLPLNSDHDGLVVTAQLTQV